MKDKLAMQKIHQRYLKSFKEIPKRSTGYFKVILNMPGVGTIITEKVRGG